MKGHEKILEVLNSLLADELTAISQYMVHSEMMANWGYEKLHEAFEKRAMDEMKHAEKLIGRILFLEGTPMVTKLNRMHVGNNIEEQLKYDWEAEIAAIKAYNDAIHLAAECKDAATRSFLQQILLDEEAHIDLIEQMRDQIGHLGVQLFLTTQVGK